MSDLLPLPKPPEGIQLGLKCPQSVLYIDLGLRGCTAPAFRRLYGVDHAFNYISMDDGIKSFNLTNSEFMQKLSPELKADVIAQKFITTMARNIRKLVRTAQIVSSPTRWRSSHFRQDLLEDLNAYWDAYEDHANCMYLFWGIENFVMNSITDELYKAGFQEEVDSGLPSFIVPSESNWFALEKQNLEILKSRFADEAESEAALDAASFHADTFGITYTPYNLGTPPSGKNVVEQIKQPPEPTKNDIKALDSFPEYIVQLGKLVRELAFWKSERTDTLSIADHYATPMYKALSTLLEIPQNLLYYMTRDELTEAINGTRQVSTETLEQRKQKYCLALIDGKISFYQPTDNEAKKEPYVFKNGDTIRGVPASPGVVRGRVRILAMGESNPVLEPDEIIVTSMTRPELGAALDVALAYVTDEGGRLCHAAIVSREKKKPCIVGVRLNHAIVVSRAKKKPCVVGASLNHATIVSREKNKPCVVGTRKATEVLQNGMLIEVDGTKGTVTVL